MSDELENELMELAKIAEREGLSIGEYLQREAKKLVEQNKNEE